MRTLRSYDKDAHTVVIQSLDSSDEEDGDGNVKEDRNTAGENSQQISLLEEIERRITGLPQKLLLPDHNTSNGQELILYKPALNVVVDSLRDLPRSANQDEDMMEYYDTELNALREPGASQEDGRSMEFMEIDNG